MYVCYVLNFTYNNSIKAVPMHKLTGSTQDISPLLHFKFKEKVYYKIDDSDFPSETHEGLAWFVGIGESVGHALTCISVGCYNFPSSERATAVAIDLMRVPNSHKGRVAGYYAGHRAMSVSPPVANMLPKCPSALCGFAE